MDPHFEIKNLLFNHFNYLENVKIVKVIKDFTFCNALFNNFFIIVGQVAFTPAMIRR